MRVSARYIQTMSINPFNISDDGLASLQLVCNLIKAVTPYHTGIVRENTFVLLIHR